MIKILSKEDAAAIQTEQILPDIYTLINELFKNSIDGNATEIDIRIDLIKDDIIYAVEDNGEGIEVNECFLKRGATSKYSEKHQFYGYKGMSLHALRTAADFTVLTKTKDSDGIKIEVKNNEISKRIVYKESTGTTVRVVNYYKKKPIRYNYLLNTLSKNITNLVSKIRKYSLVHNISVKLYKNNNILYKTPYNNKTLNIRERILSMYNIKEYKSIMFCSDTVKLEYIITFTPKNERRKEERKVDGIVHTEAVLVDNQKIDKLLSNIVNLDGGVYYILKLKDNYREIAVLSDLEKISAYDLKNILKENTDESKIVIDIKSSINNKDDAHRAIYSQNRNNTARERSTENSSILETPNIKRTRVIDSNLFAASLNKESVNTMVIYKDEKLVEHSYTDGISLNIEELKELKVVGQFNNGFILCTIEKKDGVHMYIVDQHAADEAVNYEKLKTTYGYKRQKLIQPVQINVNNYDLHIIEENIKEIESHGFVLNSSYREILEAPVYSETVFGEKELLEVVDSIKNETATRGQRILFSDLRKIMASKACRTSIMIGQALNTQQMKHILEELSKTTRPWNCPHGRPTILLMQRPKK